MTNHLNWTYSYLPQTRVIEIISLAPANQTFLGVFFENEDDQTIDLISHLNWTYTDEDYWKKVTLSISLAPANQTCLSF